ncbi:MAG: FAD-dependent oxidoreductase [Candidatus Woesebacteria bacterium]|jgi:protoporphyrinogen oxidase
MSKTKIAIIGAGFAGLAAAWELSKYDFEVTVLESQTKPGGLAGGFKEKAWQWSLEKHYHHVFTTDKDIQEILQEMGLADLLFFKNTRTATLYQGNSYQLDSAMSLLAFPKISFFSRFRMGLVLAALKFNPYGKFLERYTASHFIKKTMGNEAWEVVWGPLFVAKFGQYKDKVNAAWFWARLFARSKQLGYFRGGFLNLAERMVDKLKQKKVVFKFDKKVEKIDSRNGKVILSVKSKQGHLKKLKFDKLLVTVDSSLLPRLLKQLAQKNKNDLSSLPYLGVQTLVIQLNKAFFKDKTYWLNINEKNWPFMAVVEHTNLIKKKFYANSTLLYIGKYLDINDRDFKLNKKELFNKYKSYLNKLSPDFQKNLKDLWLFKENFAQPVVGINHSRLVPSFKLAIENCYWVSMQHIYPWDRGVNYAIKLARKAAQFIVADLER